MWIIWLIMHEKEFLDNFIYFKEFANRLAHDDDDYAEYSQNDLRSERLRMI